MLKNITLVAAPVAINVNNNALKYARQRMLDNLSVQLKIAEAFARGETYVHRAEQRLPDGKKEMVIVKVKPWFMQDSKKQWCVSLRYQNKLLPLSEAGPVALAGDAKNLPNVVKALFDAVLAGDVDELLLKALEAKHNKDQDQAEPEPEADHNTETGEVK